jgi:hypothetical protein
MRNYGTYKYIYIINPFLHSGFDAGGEDLFKVDDFHGFPYSLPSVLGF